MNPSIIHLIPKRSPKWIQADAWKERAGDFAAAGFESLGAYTVKEMPGILMEGYSHKTLPIIGAITEHPMAGFICEMVVCHADGSGATVADSGLVGNLDNMPGQTKLSFPGAKVSRLLRETRKHIKAGAFKVSKQEFATFFEGEYRKEQEWRNARGFSEDEIKRTAEALGGNYDDALIASTTKAMNKKQMPVEQEGTDPASIEEIAWAMVTNPLMPMALYKPTGPMAKAIRKALQEFPLFLDRFRAKPKTIKDYLVRVRLRFQNQEFFAWVRLTEAGKGRYTGVSVHRGEFGPLKKKAVVKFKQDQVTDWACRNNGLWQGHHTGMILMDRMNAQGDKLEKRAAQESKRLEKELAKAMEELFSDAKTEMRKGIKGKRATAKR